MQARYSTKHFQTDRSLLVRGRMGDRAFSVRGLPQVFVGCREKMHSLDTESATAPANHAGACLTKASHRVNLVTKKRPFWAFLQPRGHIACTILFTLYWIPHRVT